MRCNYLTLRIHRSFPVVEPGAHITPAVATMPAQGLEAGQAIARPASDRLRVHVQQARDLDGPQHLIVYWLGPEHLAARALTRGARTLPVAGCAPLLVPQLPQLGPKQQTDLRKGPLVIAQLVAPPVRR